MSRSLVTAGTRCLQRFSRHNNVLERRQGLHCCRCLSSSSGIQHRISSLVQLQPSARTAGRGLHGSAAAAAPEDPTRSQSPDKLYSLLELELRTHDTAVLESYTVFLKQAARHLEISIGRIYDPPRHFERMSLLKSVHIFAKHKVQYEIRTYFRVVELLRLTGSTADTFLEYSQRMLPEGIAMKVTRHAREPLPEHLTRRPEPEVVPAGAGDGAGADAAEQPPEPRPAA